MACRSGGSGEPLTFNQRLDLARRHGTLGEYLLWCPCCSWQWRAKVRWHKERGKWLLLTWQSACCPACWRQYLHLSPGKKFRRMGEYEGPFTEAEDRACRAILAELPEA